MSVVVVAACPCPSNHHFSCVLHVQPSVGRSAAGQLIWIVLAVVVCVFAVSLCADSIADQFVTE